MSMKKDNSFLWLLLLILVIVVFVSVCRYKTTKTSLPPNNTKPGNTTRAATDNSNLLLGNPTNATHSSSNADNYLIDHTYYMESYNSRKGTPNWVSWHISATDLGTTDRIDDFRQDNNLPGGWFSVLPGNYKNSGFDKGHNCPSGDRTASRDANSSTFLMDNMIPQAPKNNQQTWEHLERYCRNEVQKGNEAYVVMGNYGSGGTGSKGYKTTISSGRINVPAHIWKVVVIIPEGNNDLARINNKTRVIAIDTPNDNSIAPNWMNYVTTISNIESACQCDLLSALPATLQKELEVEKFKGGN